MRVSRDQTGSLDWELQVQLVENLEGEEITDNEVTIFIPANHVVAVGHQQCCDPVQDGVGLQEPAVEAVGVEAMDIPTVAGNDGVTLGREGHPVHPIFGIGLRRPQGP